MEGEQRRLASESAASKSSTRPGIQESPARDSRRLRILVGKMTGLHRRPAGVSFPRHHLTAAETRQSKARRPGDRCVLLRAARAVLAARRLRRRATSCTSRRSTSPCGPAGRATVRTSSRRPDRSPCRQRQLRPGSLGGPALPFAAQQASLRLPALATLAGELCLVVLTLDHRARRAPHQGSPAAQRARHLRDRRRLRQASRPRDSPALQAGRPVGERLSDQPRPTCAGVRERELGVRRSWLQESWGMRSGR